MAAETASPYQHIGCCIDDSAAAQGALEEAVRLRAMGPGRLSVVHVAAPPGAMGYSPWTPGPRHFLQAAGEWLDALVAGVPDAEPVLLWGDPATRVEQWARGSHCDLLIAATHTGPVEGALFGSFSRSLVAHAPCPVLFTRPRPPSTIAAAVDQAGKLFADAEHAMSPGAAWTPEHMLLAALARRAVMSLHHRAAVAGREAGGRATASADRGGRPSAPSLDAVWVGVDADMTPPLEGDELVALVRAAEHDTTWAIPLARRVRFSWRVNGESVET